MKGHSSEPMARENGSAYLNLRLIPAKAGTQGGLAKRHVSPGCPLGGGHHRGVLRMHLHFAAACAISPAAASNGQERPMNKTATHAFARAPSFVPVSRHALQFRAHRRAQRRHAGNA